MSDISFETALGERVEDMLDACTRCGKCVEVCPSVKPAGISDTRSEDIISGVLDLVRTGDGPEASRKWAASCMLSGECIKACDYGVNPRFLLAMARLGIAKAEHELPDRRRQGVERYRDLSRDVTVLSRLQLDGEVLERLGQNRTSYFTLAAMCSRRRISRCLPSISWMCSALLTRSWADRAIVAASCSCVLATSRSLGAWARARWRSCRTPNLVRSSPGARAATSSLQN